MADRISSAMIPQSALASISLAQQQLVEAARQSSAQTKATDMKGYGRQAQTLVSAQRLVARTESFLSTTNELKTRMSIQDVALGRAADQIAKLKDDLFQNVGLENGDGVRSSLEETFSVLKDAMNTNLGGRYLFGGVLNDQPPITATSLSNLAANPLTSSIVQGAPAQVERVEAGRTVTAGPVADDVITKAMASLQRLAQMDEGSDGPFGGPLTDNQKTALQNELGALADAFNGLLAAQAENGRLSKDVASAATRQQGNLDSLNGAVGDIVNVDLAAVAVKLNQAQFAYQASAGVFSTIKGLSLLNYLSPPTS
jgi:flagellar hook-associated protein 3 FlgL